MSFQFPGETSWSVLDSKLFLTSHMLSKTLCSKFIQKAAASHRYCTGQSHCRHLPQSSHPPLNRNLCSTLPAFSGQSFLVKTWVWSCYFSTQSCVIASHLKQSKIQSLCNSQRGLTWSSPILSVFPDISLLFCPSDMSPPAVPLFHFASASLAFLTAFLIPGAREGPLYSLFLCLEHFFPDIHLANCITSFKILHYHVIMLLNYHVIMIIMLLNPAAWSGSLMHPKHLEQFLAQSRYSGNMCWMY